jgi:hypothetical protein
MCGHGEHDEKQDSGKIVLPTQHVDQDGYHFEINIVVTKPR